MTDLKYSVQWNDPQGFGFWIRGIRPDGFYYGELHYAFGDATRRAATMIEGSLSTSDWARGQSLIGVVCRLTTSCAVTWTGQLASWTTSSASPTILFRYNPGDESQSLAARAFIELKSLLLSMMQEKCDRLANFARTAHQK